MGKLQTPEVPLVSVKKIADYFNRLIDKQSALKKLIVRGELTEVTLKEGAYMYFTMKEDDCILRGVMFNPYVSKLDFKPKPGDMVDVTGGIQNYESKGYYQLRATDIVMSGRGQYYIELEKLKKKLAAEGFFDSDRKKAIPPYCKKVGIITTDTGRGKGDIVKNARQRNPFVQLIMIPARVEGKSAGEQIARAIKMMDSLGVDCIILGRGGGGADTLFSFNEEIVARAMFECNTPIISAVGHEDDWTIADLIADVRVSTPTAAAVKAVFSLDEALYRLENDMQSLYSHMTHKLENKALRLESLENKLNNVGPAKQVLRMNSRLRALELRLTNMSPVNVLKQRKSSLDGYEKTIRLLMDAYVNRDKNRIEDVSDKLPKLMDKRLLELNNKYRLLCAKLDLISPLKRLSGGYVYMSKDAAPVSSVNSLKVDDKIELLLSDGRVNCNVDSISESPFKQG